MNCNKAQTTREVPPGPLQKYRAIVIHYNEYGNVLKRKNNRRTKQLLLLTDNGRTAWHLEPMWDSSVT